MCRGKDRIRKKLREELGALLSSPTVATVSDSDRFQIEYFNKRRVLAEQQKSVLQQMKNQSDSS